MVTPDYGKQQEMLLKLSKMLLMNLAEKENLTGVSLVIDTGFARFLQVLHFSVKTVNGFKLLNIFTKYPVLDV